MKHVALLMIAITSSVAAHAQEMIEVPNPPPPLPRPKPSPIEAKREHGRVLRDLGIGVTVAGCGLFLGGLGYLTGTTISDFFGPYHPDPSFAPTTLGLTISGALLAGGQQRSHTEVLPLLFERQRPRVRSKHSGLGLGLTIARHIVELHGGTIAANSAGEGHGATFTVRLPQSRR